MTVVVNLLAKGLQFACNSDSSLAKEKVANRKQSALELRQCRLVCTKKYKFCRGPATHADAK